MMKPFNKFNDFFDKATCPHCGSIMTIIYSANYICPKCKYKRKEHIKKIARNVK